MCHSAYCEYLASGIQLLERLYHIHMHLALVKVSSASLLDESSN